MNKSYTLMELEAIKKLCKSVNLIANLPTDLIADTNVATNTTYSSYRIDAEMSALENDIQRYVDTALAGLSRLTKEVIDDKALVVKENVLYLYKDPTDMNNDYMQMMLINGVAIELGSTTCDFSSVYSKDEIDDKFALKIDLDVLTTSFNDLVTTVDKKIDKDKITTVLDGTVTDEQVPSAKVVYEELDKKIEKDNIVTVLDDTVTDEDIPSAKTIFDTIMNKKGECTTLRNTNLDTIIKGGLYYVQSSCSNLPYDCTGGYLCVLYNNELPDTYLTQIMLNWNGKKMYIRTMNGGSWYEWGIITTTKVKNESNVDVTSSMDTAVATVNSIAYTIKNGICYVRVNNLKPLITCNETIILPNGTLPKASTSLCYANISTWSETNFSSVLLQPNTNGSLDLWCTSNALNKAHYGMFSYLVAE